MKRLSFLLTALAMQGCISTESAMPKTTNATHAVRLHGSSKDCDTEKLNYLDQYLCDYLHGRPTK